MMDDDPRCSLCGQTRSWHQENGPRHHFTLSDGSTPLKMSDEVPQMKRVDLPFDPILRMALVNAGVITTDQLRQAERDYHAINGGGYGGERPTDTGPPKGV